jgi:hypothetical protein
MTKGNDPERMLVGSIDELIEITTARWLDMDVTVSWGTTWKLRVFGLVHPFGIHYLVPLKQFDPASKRLVSVGTTCWFCNA